MNQNNIPPSDNFDQIRKDMNKFLLQQISIRHTLGHFKGKWLPPTDVYETNKLFIIVLELPGVNKDDIDVLIEKNKLTISGNRKEIKLADLESYYQVEINYGPFERVIFLPDSINSSSVEAQYNNGFLIISIKKESQKPNTKVIRLSSIKGK